MDLNQFIKDRKEAVLSADLNMIKAYCKKYGVPLPPSGDIPLMRGMQLCVFRLTDVPYKEKRDAWTNYSVWLMKHGYFFGQMLEEEKNRKRLDGTVNT